MPIRLFEIKDGKEVETEGEIVDIRRTGDKDRYEIVVETKEEKKREKRR